jgi:hypothetical protein
MLSLLKLLFWVGLAVAFVWAGQNIQLGKHTLFGHVERIWATPEAQDLVDGTKEKAGPAVDKLKKGVKAGVEAATAPDRPKDAGP